MICEQRASGAPSRKLYVMGEQRGMATLLYASDHLGSVRQVSDGSGAILGTYAYDPWGRRSLESGAMETDIGFTGHKEVMGLWLSLYRAYDPDLGRWLNDDPIGTQGGINLGAYVNNNPVGLRDPLGLVAVHISSPRISYKPQALIGSCGATVGHGKFDGTCSCASDGKWYASLEIVYKPTIEVANDRMRYPDASAILNHELRHDADNLEVIRRAHAEGDEIESRAFLSESACQTRVNIWIGRWNTEMVNQAGWRNFLDKTWRSKDCGKM